MIRIIFIFIKHWHLLCFSTPDFFLSFITFLSKANWYYISVIYSLLLSLCEQTERVADIMENLAPLYRRHYSSNLLTHMRNKHVEPTEPRPLIQHLVRKSKIFDFS